MQTEAEYDCETKSKIGIVAMRTTFLVSESSF